MTRRILVGGSRAASEPVHEALRAAGYEIDRITQIDGETGAMQRARADAIVVCVGEESDLELVHELASPRRDVAVIATGEPPMLVAAARAGAIELCATPVAAGPLCASVTRAMALGEVRRAVSGVRRSLADHPDAMVVGDSPQMRDVRRTITQVSGCDVDMLVSGEHGTGKKLITRAVHASSPRASGPLVYVDVSSLLPEEHATRLFGERNEPGALVEADGGTLVIEEPEGMAVDLQASLVRALRERTVVGRHGAIAFDVRVIATTTRRLEHLSVLGDFDQELYDHLATVVVHVPPLRERGCDVLQLAAHFVERSARVPDEPIPSVTAAASRELLAYGWPGNVRELEDAIAEAARANVTGRIEVSDLPERVLDNARPAATPAAKAFPSLDDVERRYISEVLAAVDGNKSRASRVLGVDRRTLYRKLRKLGLSAAPSVSQAPS